MNIAMIIAGGVGARLTDKMPKQYIKVLGKPVIAYTMEAFQNAPFIDAITLVSISSMAGKQDRNP